MDALASSEALLDRPPPLIELLPVAVYACDAAGRIRWYNGRAAALWGRRPRSDQDGLFCGALRVLDEAGNDLPPVERPLARALAGFAAAARHAIRVERPDGAQIPVLTHIQLLSDEAGRVCGAIGCLHDISELKQAEDRLREREHAQRELLEALPVAVCTTDADGSLTFYNKASVALWGRRPRLHGEPFDAEWRERSAEGAELQPEDCAIAQALREQRPLTEVEAQIRRPDGRRVPVLEFPAPLRDAAGTITGAVNMLVDISASKRAELRQKALIDELNHRVKNTLATVQSLALQTFRGQQLPALERAAFEGRLLALSRAHDQLTATRWETAQLPSLLLAVLAPHRDPTGQRVKVEGPPCALSPRVALTLAIVVHELASNAVRYGALSVPAGRVAVTWGIDATLTPRRLTVVWREQGGPAARTPTRGGFGTRYIQRAVEGELSGRVRFDYGPQGLLCEFELPLGDG